MKKYNEAFFTCLLMFVFLLGMTLWYEKISLTLADPFATIGIFTIFNVYFSLALPIMINIFKIGMVFYWFLMVIIVFKRDSWMRLELSN